ncbi:hypothetical protein E4U43_005366, partial [Claviceps pusilla]
TTSVMSTVQYGMGSQKTHMSEVVLQTPRCRPRPPAVYSSKPRPPTPCLSARPSGLWLSRLPSLQAPLRCATPLLGRPIAAAAAPAPVGWLVMSTDVDRC